MVKAKTREEKLFAAAVLRRSFELRGEEHGAAFQSVYEGVLRDLGLEDAEVVAHLGTHRAEVDEYVDRWVHEECGYARPRRDGGAVTRPTSLPVAPDQKGFSSEQ